MNNYIYVLNNCDEWKSKSSMSLIMVSTSLERIKREIIKQLKDGNIEYKKGNENISKTAQIKMLMEDYKNDGIQFVFDNIEYGFVNIVIDGEVQ